MQTVSSLYEQLLANSNHEFEYSVVFGDGEPDNGYKKDSLISMETSRKCFKSSNPTVGCAISGEISLTMLNPSETLERRAKIRPYVRITANGQSSEWLPKGVFYIDIRSSDEEEETITIHGYDDILRMESPYPSSSLTWGTANDHDVIHEIADYLGIEVDARTDTAIPVNKYSVPLPSGYTIRETLCYIASMYGGNWVMSDEGKLLYIGLLDLPEETYLLVNENGNYITFGGTRILLRAST